MYSDKGHHLMCKLLVGVIASMWNLIGLHSVQMFEILFHWLASIEVVLGIRWLFSGFVGFMTC